MAPSSSNQFSSVPGLNLVVASNGLRVARRHRAVTAALSGTALLRRPRATGIVVRAVAHVCALLVVRETGLLLGLAGVGGIGAAAVDEDIGDVAALAVVLREGLVLVVRFGEFGDDVPCVDEAGDLVWEVLVGASGRGKRREREGENKYVRSQGDRGEC